MSVHCASRHALPTDLATGLARRRLPGLDGLRAIAAYLVVFFHFELPWVPGGLGVLMFFVLSGFLITWLLLDEIGEHGTVGLGAFYVRRALRIVPAFYVYAGGLLAALAFFGKPIVWGQAIASIFYVNNYYQAILGDPNTGLSHTWSLGIEEQFYLLWPLAFVALHRRGRLVRGLVVAIVCVWVHRWTLIALGVHEGYIYEAFDTRADHLMVGCLLAVSLRDGRAVSLWRAACAHAAMPAVTVIALAGSAAFSYLVRGYRDAVGAVLEPLLVAVLIVQLIAFAGSRGWRWTGWPAVRYLGRISYSVYLYQQLVPTVVEAALGGQPFAVRLTAHVVGVTLAASASYWIVEQPFLTLKARFGAGVRPASAASGVPEPAA